MADRTLRRKYTGNAGNTTSNVDGVGTDAGTNAEPIERITVSESNVDGVSSNDVIKSNSDSSIGVIEIDPANLGNYIANATGDGTGSDSQPRKRRGRKPGTRNAKAKASDSVSIEPFLMLAHTWASVLLKCPEIAIEKDEAKQLADAYAVFAQHHDIPVLSEKRMSEINLIACVCMMYGPRFIAVRNRIKEESKLKRAKNVTTMQPNIAPFQSEVMQ